MCIFQCGHYKLDISRPLIMAIVNLTPDSFSGDGRGADIQAAIDHAWAQIEAGADLIDLGAESTRPGAVPASANMELDRLLPVLDALRDCDIPISVDTYKPDVMRQVLRAGASMINDVNGMRHAEALEVVSATGCGLGLMHMQGQPLTMQTAPDYGDVVREVAAFLEDRVEACVQAGVVRERLLVDPGFGFGKTLAHNLDLFRALPRFKEIAPVLVGVSRKSMLGAITGQPVEKRVSASAVAAVLAAQRGSAVIRVHDVAVTRDAISLWQAIEQTGEKDE